MEKCKICGNELNSDEKYNQSYEVIYYSCPSCGLYLCKDYFRDEMVKYYDKNKLAEYLNSTKIDKVCKFLGSKDAYNAYIKQNTTSKAIYVPKNEVNSSTLER